MKLKIKIFFKRMFFCFCSFLVLLTLLSVLMSVLIPKEVLEQIQKEQSDYNLLMTFLIYISFLVSYFVIIWFEGFLKNHKKLI